MECTQILFTVVLLGLHFGHNCGLRININPQTFNTLSSNTVNISCTMDSQVGRGLKNILIMKISKQDESPIVYIRPKYGITYVTQNVTKYRVEGHIYGNDIRQSYLRLTLLNPQDTDSGIYMCESFYLDELTALKHDSASGNLTIVNIANSDIMVELMRTTLDRVSQMEDKIKRLEKNLEDCARQNSIKPAVIEKVNTLEETSRNQSRQIKSLIANESAVIDRLNTLEETGWKQSLHIKNMTKIDSVLIDRVNTLEDTTWNQSRHIKNLIENESALVDRMDMMNKTSWNQSRQIIDLIENDRVITGTLASLDNETRIQSLRPDGLAQKVTYTSAFSVTNNYRITPKSNSALVLPDVITLEGEGYNTTTGIYTAPVDGLYAFHFTLTSGCPDCLVEVNVIANDNDVIAHAFGKSTKQLVDQSSVSAVVDLHAGDTVKARINYARGVRPLHLDQVYVFSGYLVRPY